MRTVLYFKRGYFETCQVKLQGAVRYANKAKWQLQVIEDAAAAPSKKRLLSFWKPDGCIVDCGGDGTVFLPKDFRGIPTVFIDCPPHVLTDDIDSVSNDSKSSAELVARELIGLGRSHYAFVSANVRREWSDIRLKTFCEILSLHGKKCNVFDHKASDAHDPRYQGKLQNWLRELPRPLAVFAADDSVARATVTAAIWAGLSVPDDVATISIDNNKLLALSSCPTLTSVQIDFEHAGFLAASALAQRFENPSLPAARITFGPLHLFRRASSVSGIRHDSQTEAAREFIRREVANGINARDVVALYSCSRRMADSRFRAATGHSILEEILSERMSIVQMLLLREEITLDRIAELSGWKSTSSLRQFFKKRTGLSLSDWRRRNLAHTPGSASITSANRLHA